MQKKTNKSQNTKNLKPRWLVNLNMKGKTIQFLHTNMQDNPCDLEVGTYFLNKQHKNINFLLFCFKLKTSVNQKHHLKDWKYTLQKLKYGSGWCGSVDWVQDWETNGGGLDSQSRHSLGCRPGPQ